MTAIVYKTKDRIKFTYRIDDKIDIIGNRDAVTQIFNNLVSNSIDSIKEKGRISINVEKRCKGKIIKVKDNSCGIKKENLDKIFDAFYTTKIVGKCIGFGLNIVKNLVLKMNWHIKVNSTETQGTTFAIITS